MIHILVYFRFTWHCRNSHICLKAAICIYILSIWHFLCVIWTKYVNLRGAFHTTAALHWCMLYALHCRAIHYYFIYVQRRSSSLYFKLQFVSAIAYIYASIFNLHFLLLESIEAFQFLRFYLFASICVFVCSLVMVQMFYMLWSLVGCCNI